MTNTTFELADEELQEFIEIWKEEFKETLTEDEARFQAKRFLDLFWLLAKHKPPLQSRDAIKAGTHGDSNTNIGESSE